MREAISAFDIRDPETQIVFGFQPATIWNTYRVLPGSRLDEWVPRWSACTTPSVDILGNGEGGLVVAGGAIKDAVSRTLTHCLKTRLIDENQRCKRAKAFVPCLQFLVNGYRCVENCSMLHIHGEDITEQWLNDYLRIHLLQIRVYQVYHSSPLNNSKNIEDCR